MILYRYMFNIGYGGLQEKKNSVVFRKIVDYRIWKLKVSYISVQKQYSYDKNYHINAILVIDWKKKQCRIGSWF